MEIKFLGTAAYEGVPAPFCRCATCKKALRTGGRNIRTRSQALINDDLLIDFNPDTVVHYQTYAFDWEKINDCLITHSHSDHLYVDDVAIAMDCYTHQHKKLNFYSGKAGYDMLKSVIGNPGMKNAASVTLVNPGNKFKINGGKYIVTAYEANHAKDTSPLFYAIEDREGKRLLYAHDTGWFSNKTWDLLEKTGRFDFVSLDCTGCNVGGASWTDHHMGLKTDLKVIEKMKKSGIADDKTIFVVNHFSHNGGQTYDELVPDAEKQGIIVSYDGLEIDF